MKRQGFLTITMGALVLGGLITAGCVSGSNLSAVAQSAGAIDLRGVPPNWDKALPAAQRFVVLAEFNNNAVRDNNTGLVWEKSPQTATAHGMVPASRASARTSAVRKGGACRPSQIWLV